MAFKGRSKPAEATYADLTEGDTIVDRNGNEWLALDVDRTMSESTSFWLAEIVGRTRKHRMTKPSGDAVTIMREPDRAEVIADLEAGMDAAEAKTSEPVTEPEAVAAVEEVLGGEVIAEETADHEAERDLARAGGEPMSLPAFAEFTDPEMRSHIFLVHGVYAHDVKTIKALAKMHDDLHGEEAGQHTPHDHTSKEFPS